jgi:transposase-like protein
MAEHKRSFSAADKAKIIREGLAGTRPITEVCRHYGITATQYYDWQKRALAGMADALENRPKNGKYDKHAAALSKAEEKLAKLHRVITEITLENMELKKTLGD